MAKKRIPGTKALFEETEAVAAALARRPEHLPRDIPVAQLVPSRFNPRHAYSREALAELTRSIEEHGFIGALDGRELPDGRVELAYGSRRLLAARHAGLRSLPVALHAWNDEQMCLVSLVENMARAELSQEDLSEIVSQLREALSVEASAIAEAVGKTTAWVDDQLAADEAGSVEEADPDEVKLDEVVSSILVDSEAGTVPPVFELDVRSELTARPSRHWDRSSPRARTSSAVQASDESWLETGTTMLMLASDSLEAFDPGAVGDDEVERALDCLFGLSERIGAYRSALEDRR